MSEHPPSRDRYTHGHHASVVAQHARRTAEDNAAYLLPHLEVGMRLLDLGCGPGSITTGLARAVAPGTAIGVDMAENVLETARAEAARGRVENLRFETGSAYALAYPDDSFDAAHAHQLLQHLTAPVDALLELRRVLRPGAIVGVRDSDYATMVAWPRRAEIDRWLELYRAVTARNGAEADAGRRLPSWLRAAGFERIEVSATTMLYHERSEVENWGRSWADRITQSSLAEQAIVYSLATAEELEAIAAGWRAWAAEPEAVFFYVNLECLGRAP